MDGAETIAIITTEGWFTSKPSLSGVEDIIGYHSAFTMVLCYHGG